MLENTAVQDPEVVDVPEEQQEDYFGFKTTHRFTLPDRKSWIEFKTLNEGEKAQWEKETQGDVVYERNSGNARLRMNTVTARHSLIRLAVVDWNLKRNGQPVRLSHGLQDFLKLTNPKIVLDLEAAIRKENPFLITDLTIEEIDKQIEELLEQKKILEERQQGE
jgi:hypothetical protein